MIKPNKLAAIYLIACSFITYGQDLLDQEDLNSLEQNTLQNKDLNNLNKNASRSISLQTAIEEGLRLNYDQKIRKYEFQINEINFDDAFDDFFFPKVNLNLATSSDHFVENLYRDNYDNAQDPRTPNGYVGIEIEDYTLFNWGRDYLDYLNSKDNYQREKKSFTEEKRALRLSIIAEYFNLSRQNRVVQIYKKQLSHTSFVYRLAREKLSLQKIRSQEFLQAKSLFLEAHKNYQDSLNTYYAIQENLALLMGTELDASLQPTNELIFKALNINKDDSLKFALKNNPGLLEARKNVNVAARSYQRALKDNLPLPKFSVKLGTYNRSISSSGAVDNYETFNGSKNIEIAASLNMTWRLYGSGGFFNSRITKKSFYNKQISEIKLRESSRSVHSTNYALYSQIKYLEKKYEAANARIKNARKSFDKSIDDYLSSKLSLSALQQVLNELRFASIDFESTKYEHLVSKLNLAQLMGVDDFPGDNFDQLAR